MPISLSGAKLSASDIVPRRWRTGPPPPNNNRGETEQENYTSEDQAGTVASAGVRLDLDVFVIVAFFWSVITAVIEPFRMANLISDRRCSRVLCNVRLLRARMSCRSPTSPTTLLSPKQVWTKLSV